MSDETVVIEQLECFHLLVEGVKDCAILMLDPQGRVVSWNAGAERILGYSAEEIIGQHFSRFHTSEDVQQGEPERELQAAVEGRCSNEGWRVCKDGSRFWANGVMTALWDKAGHLKGFSKITRDLTERKQAEERMRSVVDYLLDAIISFDEQGALTTFNPAAEKLFGYPASEAIGTNVKILMPEPYHGQHDGYIANYLRTGQAKIIGIGREVVGRRKDGSTFPMDLTISEFRLGETRYFTGSVRDLTERKRDREALEQARDELEKRVQDRTLALEEANAALQEINRRKDEFLAMLGHELRNPLAPIRTGLHILRMPHAKDVSSDRVMNLMEREVQNLTRLVDDLLDVSRITRGKIRLRNETIDLASVVHHAVETVGTLIEAQRHELSVSLPPEPVFLQADPTRLEQVVANLLNNAAKYTEQGGHIFLTGEREGAEVAVRVRDTGIGISADLLPHVFDLFAQADHSLARSQGGLGVGLTLVRRLLEMMGGSVTAHSEGPGKGSEFVVRLPALPKASLAEPEAPVKETPSSNRPVRVLVVEDDETVAEMHLMLLKRWGHDVRSACDGFAAVVAARTFQPDVILLDIGLPGMDGYDVAAQLRLEALCPRPLIAAVTGYGQEKDRWRAHEAGCDYHMVKPIDPNALQASWPPRNRSSKASRAAQPARATNEASKARASSANRNCSTTGRASGRREPADEDQHQPAHAGRSPHRLRRRPTAAEGAQHFVQVRRDGDLVVQEVLQPQMIGSLGEGQQRQQVRQADPHVRFLRFGFFVELQRIDAEMGSHSHYLPATNVRWVSFVGRSRHYGRTVLPVHRPGAADNFGHSRRE